MNRQRTMLNQPNPSPPGKGGVVYVIDDDEAIRDSLALLLNA